MKTTVRHIAGAIVVCTGLVVCLGIYHKSVLVSALDDDVFKLDSSTRCLIVGDSHTETALDPDILGNTANISKSAENLFYTYYKLKHYLKHNPQIRHVVLGVSFHNFTKASEAYIFDDSRNHLFLDSYYLLLDADGKNIVRSLNTNNIVCLLKYDLNLPMQIYGTVYSNNIFRKKIFGIALKDSDFNFIGRYIRLNYNKVSEEYILSKISELYNMVDGNYVGNSEIMTDYFYRILSLCSEKSIKLSLYNGPLHQNLYAKIPMEAISSYNRAINSARSDFPSVKYVDHSTVVRDSKLFGDGDHVNGMGSTYVSNLFAPLLSNQPSENE